MPFAADLQPVAAEIAAALWGFGNALGHLLPTISSNPLMPTFWFGTRPYLPCTGIPGQKVSPSRMMWISSTCLLRSYRSALCRPFTKATES